MKAGRAKQHSRVAMRLVLVLWLSAAACSADRDASTALPDAATDAPGIPLDTSSVDDAGVDELIVQPAVHTLKFDVAAESRESLNYSVLDGTTELTPVATFSVDPSVATMAGNSLTTKWPLPEFEIGKTFIVTARANGKRGRAKLTIVRLKTTGEKDFLFESAHGATPFPDKDLFRVLTTTDNGGLGSDVRVVLRNDPLNPPIVDARKLVTVRAMAEGYPKLEPPACEAQATKDSDADGTHDTFIASPTPRALCFEVRPVTNVLVTSGEDASFHRVFVDVVTETGKTLATRSVVVMVPATSPVPR